MYRPATKHLMWATLLGISPILAVEPPRQSAQCFEQAIRDHSTAQPYVLITLVDNKSGEAGFDQAENIALAVPSHVYQSLTDQQLRALTNTSASSI